MIESEPHKRLCVPFTPAEDTTIREYVTAGYFAAECATKLGRSRNSIISRAARMGLHFDHRSRKKGEWHRYG